MRRLSACLILMLIWTWVQPAAAAFHLWDIREIYSNDDGTIQFLELFTTSNSQQFTGAHQIRTNSSPPFVFPSNTLSPTANHHLLLATEGFRSTPGSVPPDFVIPNNFFNSAGDTINFVGADSVTFVSLPTDGVNSLNYPGAVVQAHSPTNYRGQIGSLTLEPPPVLQAGDADQDLDVDQFDLIKVQVANKYLSGQPATWGEGDWNGAPGGSVGNPPAGDQLFNQLDLVAALRASLYLTGKYAAVAAGGVPRDSQTSIGYNPTTGEVWVDPPSGVQLTSINVDSARAIFTAQPAQNLGGSFDNDSDNNIFKATFGSSFGSLSFGNVAQAGLSQEFLLNDLTVVGSLAGGGGLGDVDLIYVPEPATVLLMLLCVASLVVAGHRRRH